MFLFFFFESGLLVLRYMISGRRSGGFVFHVLVSVTEMLEQLI